MQRRKSQVSEVQNEPLDLGQVLGCQIVPQLVLTDPHVGACPTVQAQMTGEQQGLKKEDPPPHTLIFTHCLRELELVVATRCVAQELGFRFFFCRGDKTVQKYEGTAPTRLATAAGEQSPEESPARPCCHPDVGTAILGR